MRVLFCVFALLACGDPTDLAENQGPCTGLDEATCRGDSRCQQAYTESGLSPKLPGGCALLADGAPPAAACEQLDFDGCRRRNDCALIYWQDLGSDDTPVGDPYYRDCVTEASVEPR